MKHQYTIITVITVALVLLFAISVSVVSAETYYEQAMSGTGDGSYSYYTDDDPRFPDWFEVSDAELQLCSRYGGTLASQTGYQAADDMGLDTEVARLTFTIQAEKTTGEDLTLYEIAWYVHPLSEDKKYTVYLIEKEGHKNEIHVGFAEAIGGDADYQAFESDTDYEYARLVLEGETTSLTVPIVEKNP